MAFERELRVARRIATEAGVLALQYLREGVVAEDKPDASPVTAADRACERLMVEGVLSEFPDDGVLGEEGADRPAANGRKWIMDPIDGTRDYLRNQMLFANFLALEVEGLVQVGVCNFPALGEQYFAARGGGAWVSRGGAERRIRASAVSDPSQAVLCMNGWTEALRKPHAEKLLPLAGRFWACRSLGGALDAMMLASGKADFWIEPTAKPWDLAPIQVICQEAGLRYFDYRGEDTIYGGNAIVCTPGLEPLAREYLGL